MIYYSCIECYKNNVDKFKVLLLEGIWCLFVCLIEYRLSEFYLCLGVDLVLCVFIVLVKKNRVWMLIYIVYYDFEVF